MHWITKWIVAGLIAAPSLGGEALDVRLKRSATVTGERVTLGDVLAFGPGTEELRQGVAGEVIASETAGAEEVLVRYDKVHERFTELGVNLGQVLLHGAHQCEVRLLPAPKQAAAEPQAPLFGEVPDRPQKPGAAVTLGDHITAFCQREWDGDVGTVKLDFERGRDDLLGLTAPTFTFVIRAPGSRARLGLREFRVTLRRDGRNIRNVSVFAQVQVERNVLVAARPLNLGRHVKPEDVRSAKRVFASEAALGYTRSGQAVGQRLVAFVPEGQMLQQDDLEAADLVKRSASVSVYRMGPVGVRLQGTAMESGAYGERVRVRIGKSRTSRRVVTGEVTGMNEVRLLEDE